MTYNVDTCKLCGKVITTEQGYFYEKGVGFVHKAGGCTPSYTSRGYGPCPMPPLDDDGGLCTRDFDRHHGGSLPSRAHTREDNSPFGDWQPDIDAINRHIDPYDRNVGGAVSPVKSEGERFREAEWRTE